MTMTTSLDILWSPQTGLLALFSLCLYFIGLGVYRLFFSPLAKFPGPKLAALTFWVEFYHDVVRRGQYTFEIVKMHEKYGPIVRITPDELHINDPDYSDELYPTSLPTEKPRSIAEQFGNSLSVVGTVSHNLHKMRRNALNPFFSKRSVMKYADSIQSCVDKLCARFEEFNTSQTPINLRLIFGALTIDIISLYSYGKSYKTLEKSDFDLDLYQLMTSGGELALLLKQCPWIFKTIDTLPYSLVMRLNPQIRNVITRKIEIEAQIRAVMNSNIRHLKQEDRSLNVFQELLNSDTPAEERSVTRLTDESITLLAAGTISTSHALSATVYHILANPRILQIIQKELQETMYHDMSTEALLVRLEHLPYLTATITEGLRLSNVSSHRNVRAATDRSLKFQNWIIPPGVAVGMTPYMVHMNPKLFPAPEEFRPERWLEGDTEAVASSKRYFLAFGKGSRMCIGMNLAYAQFYLTLAAILGRFELRLFETTRADVDVAHDFTGGVARLDSKGVRVVVHKKLI